MAFFLQDTLYPASFKGADFFFTSDSRTDGARTAVHDYVNKADSIEDLGLPYRTFNIQAVITGDNYFNNKEKFENALNEGGSGILVHPFLGDVQCVAQSWTVAEDITKVGVATYSLQFKEVKETTFPIPSTNVVSKIADLYRKAYNKVSGFLNTNYVIKFADNIFTAGKAIERLTTQLKGIVGTVEGSAVGLAQETKSTLETVGQNVYRIASGTDIGGAVASSMSLTDNLTTDGQTRYDASNKLFGFGSANVYLNVPSAALKERYSNDRYINGAVNSLALVNMYDAAKLIKYSNDEQIDAVENDLNGKYNQILNEDKINISDEIFDMLSEIKAVVKIFFDAERLNTNKVITIRTQDIPLTVLTYQYYGSTDTYKELLTLNNVYNPSSVSGQIKVFEQP